MKSYLALNGTRGAAVVELVELVVFAVIDDFVAACRQK